MSNILEFPLERFLINVARRRRSRDIDAAIERAEQWHRVCRASAQPTLEPEPFQADQVPNNFTSHVHRLRLPLPGKC